MGRDDQTENATGSLAAQTVAGANVIVIASVIAKAGSFVTQIVLGLLLSDKEFGIYGSAIGLAAFIEFVRDGGTQHLLVQRGGNNYNKIAGTVFRIASSFNTAGALVLIALAGLFASTNISTDSAYADPRFPLMLLIIGVSIPLATPGTLFLAKLSADLRFKDIARIQTTDALLKQAAMILFAVLGAGPLSFVLPLILSALYRSIAGYRLTRDALWKRPNIRRLWKPIIGKCKWLIVLSLAIAMFNMGDYLVLGPLITAETLGVYVFAFQLAGQIQQLLGSNLRTVLFPTFTRIQHDPGRLRSAIIRATAFTTLIGASLGGGIAAVASPLIDLVWVDKWDDAVNPARILAGCFSFRLLFPMLQGIYMAQGRFRSLAGLSCAFGAAIVVAMTIVGLKTDDNTELIALVAAVTFSLSVLIALIAGTRRFGVPSGGLLRRTLVVWFIPAAAAIGAILLDDALIGSWHPIIRLVLCGSAYSVACALCFRFLLPAITQEAISLLPGKLATPARRVLRLTP